MSNNLVNETSPYLLQHKDNPVEWFSWGKEALDKAKKNQRKTKKIEEKSKKIEEKSKKIDENRTKFTENL